MRQAGGTQLLEASKGREGKQEGEWPPAPRCVHALPVVSWRGELTGGEEGKGGGGRGEGGAFKVAGHANISLKGHVCRG